MSKKNTAKESSEKIAVRFIGKEREYIPTIPCHDLTKGEWDLLSAVQQKKAIRSGLYKLVKE